MAAKRAKKSKKAKSKKRVAAKARRPASKAAKPPAKRAKVKAARRGPAKKAKKKKARGASKGRRKEVFGEGNYTASREFDKAERTFVKKNKGRIAKLGKDAEKALDGPEGDDLREAEEEAASRSHADRGAE